MRVRVFAFCLATVLVASGALAYGPSVHMREADHYIVLSELYPQPGVDHNAEFLRRHRMFLRLGAIWPDIANVIVSEAGMPAGKGGPSHLPEFNTFLLEQALVEYPDDPWKVAFAAGNLIHCTGDIVAQDMLTQRLAVKAHTGELDVLVGYFDDHAGGEVEMLLEGGLEFMKPRFDLYLDMTRYFVLSEAGLAKLLAAVQWYLPLYEEYFNPAVGFDEDEAFEIAAYYLAHPRRIVPDPEMAGLYNFAASGFTDVSGLKQVSFDLDELLRVIGEILKPAFWDTYYDEEFYLLSPYMRLTYEPGQAFYENFAIWTSKMMKSGMIQSLSYYLPEELATEGGRFVMELDWFAGAGITPITSISASDPPATVTLEVVLYDTPGDTAGDEVVMLRVREGSPSGALVAYDSANVAVDPFTYDVNEPAVLTVTFDPAPSIANGAEGFFAELAHGDNPQALPYFTTDWSVYQQIDEIDMGKAAYLQQYSTYDHWPYSLNVVGDREGR